jgi:hypothetical protein
MKKRKIETKVQRINRLKKELSYINESDYLKQAVFGYKRILEILDHVSPLSRHVILNNIPKE